MNQKKTLLYGSRATAWVLLAVFATILLNVFANYFVKAFPQAKLDITPERRYSLSKETKDYLKSVSTPIKLIALGGDAPDYVLQEMNYVQDVVSRMARQNDLISYEVFELYQDDASMEEFYAKYVDNSPEGLSVFSVIAEQEDGTFRVASPHLIDNVYTVNVSYTDFESRVVNAIHSLLHGVDAQAVSIPDKPEHHPELMLGVNPETRQADEALLVKQMITFVVVFVIALPLVMFITSIVVLIVKRKK